MSCLKSAPPNFSHCKILKKKTKMLKFGTKNALFEYFWPKMLYLGILGRILTKLLSYLKSSTRKFVYLQNLTKKQKCLNLGPKMPYLGIFYQKCLVWVFLGYNFKRTIAIFEISNPSICLIAKCHELIKMPKFGTKTALFVYFWTRIFKNYSHFWNQHPQISETAKFCEETKLPKFWTKSALFGYFWARILKEIWSHLKSVRSNL